MPIRVECPSCRAGFKAPDSAAGKRGKCPKCQAAIQVPAGLPDVEEPERASPAAAEAESTAYALADEPAGPRYLAARSSQAAPRPAASRRPSRPPAQGVEPPRAGRSALPAAEILAAFHGDIPRIHASPLYRFWILIVAMIMLLLPLVYLAIIGVACYGMFWHVTHNYTVFQTVRNAKAAVFVFLAPLAVLGTLVFFLFKPLFAAPQRRSRERSIDPSEEPLLFAFVDAVCSSVGAPTPVRIDVDCAVNASAGPERGFFSLLRRRLVLTVGLPLAATMDLRQFAGVLAHEFGHFSQSAGMKLTYLVRSINAWFYRVVNERDEWDATLDAWSHQGHIVSILMANLARLIVWLTRRILWLLMMAGHAVSCIMSRQMEYDADRYQAWLVGSPMVESVLKRINVVVAAERGAYFDLGENWKEGRLADDLPRLIAANVEQIPAQSLKAIDASIDQGKTGLFDTHPADRDRIAAARALNAPGIFHLEGPATDLFRNFEATARKATLDYYRGVFGPGFTPDHLQPVAEVVRGTEQAQEGQHALERLFLGHFNPLRGVPLPETFPARADDAAAVRDFLAEAHADLPVAHEGYGAALDRQGDAFGTLIKAEAAEILSRCDFRFKAADYELPASTLDAARAAVRSATGRFDGEAETLGAFESLCARRITAALSLLDDETIAARLEDAEGWNREVRSLYPVASNLSRRVWPKLLPVLRARVSLLAVLQNYQGNEQNERLRNAILRGGRDLHDRLVELNASLGGSLLYPFDHANGEVTIQKFALPSVPDAADIGSLLEVAQAALDRLLPLYSRALGRLALAVEEVERALGLAPPEPEA